jgi:hypothetical protein
MGEKTVTGASPGGDDVLAAVKVVLGTVEGSTGAARHAGRPRGAPTVVRCRWQRSRVQAGLEAAGEDGVLSDLTWRQHQLQLRLSMR